MDHSHTHTHTHTHTKHAVGRVRTNRNGCGTLYSLSLSLLNKQELKQNCEKKNKILFLRFFLVFFLCSLGRTGTSVAGGDARRRRRSDVAAPGVVDDGAGAAVPARRMRRMRLHFACNAQFRTTHTHTQKISKKKTTTTNKSKEMSLRLVSPSIRHLFILFFSAFFCLFLVFWRKPE